MTQKARSTPAGLSGSRGKVSFGWEWRGFGGEGPGVQRRYPRSSRVSQTLSNLRANCLAAASGNHAGARSFGAGVSTMTSSKPSSLPASTRRSPPPMRVVCWGSLRTGSTRSTATPVPTPPCATPYSKSSPVVEDRSNPSPFERVHVADDAEVACVAVDVRRQVVDCNHLRQMGSGISYAVLFE